MTKKDFTLVLREKLKRFPKQDVEERINFYIEIIDDSIEDGLTEEEAISKIGSIDEVVEQIASEIPFTKIVKNSAIPKRRLSAWEIILLVVGSPIWFGLIISLFAVVFSVFASLWAVVIVFWSVAISFSVCGPLALLLGILFIFIKSGAEGFAIIGASLVIAGVGILLVFLSKILTRLLVRLAKAIIYSLKKAFISKGE